MTNAMVKKPKEMIDLYVNFEKRKFNKNSEHLLKCLYAYEIYLKKLQP